MTDRDHAATFELIAGRIGGGHLVLAEALSATHVSRTALDHLAERLASRAHLPTASVANWLHGLPDDQSQRR